MCTAKESGVLRVGMVPTMSVVFLALTERNAENPSMRRTKQRLHHDLENDDRLEDHGGRRGGPSAD